MITISVLLVQGFVCVFVKNEKKAFQHDYWKKVIFWKKQRLCCVPEINCQSPVEQTRVPETKMYDCLNENLANMISSCQRNYPLHICSSITKSQVNHTLQFWNICGRAFVEKDKRILYQDVVPSHVVF